MFRQRFAELDLLDLRKIENQPVTLVFSRQNSFLGRLKPTEYPVISGFKFIFRKKGNLCIYVCEDPIFGRDALPSEKGITPLYLRKLFNGSYRVMNFSRGSVPATVYSPVTRNGYSELSDYLKGIREAQEQ